MLADPRLAAALARHYRAPALGAAHPWLARAQSVSFMGTAPSSDVRPFRGPKDTLQRMAQHALGPRGEQSALVRQFTEWVIRDVHPKDYLGEILAIRNVFVQWSPTRPTAPLFRYTNDPRHVEMIKDPQRIVEEIAEQGTSLVDCDDSAQMAGTMLMQIGREVEFVAMGFEPNSLSHVAVRAREPKSGKMIILDGVAGPREAEAAGKAKELLIWSLN